MAKNAINQFDKVSGGNTDVDGVNVGSGMTIDNINDAMQHLMALIAQQQGTLGAQSVDIASASLTDLTGANGWSVNVTGTNAITDFGGSTLFTGAMFWLYIVNGLTLTYGATKIVTPNNSDLQLNAGDVVQVKHEGSGKWRLVNYFPASGSALPTGTIVDYASASIPAGWLECNGQAVSRTGYPTLFAKLGTTFGAGNGTTTFNLPDLRGRVTIGSNGQTAGRLASASWNAVGAVGGEELHVLSAGELPSHTHSFAYSGSTGFVSADHTHGVTGSTGTESADHTHYTVINSDLDVRNTPNTGAVLVNHYAAGVGASSGGRSAAHSHAFSVTSSGISTNHTHAFSISGTTGATGSGTGHNTLQPSMSMTKIIKT